MTKKLLILFNMVTLYSVNYLKLQFLNRHFRICQIFVF